MLVLHLSDLHLSRYGETGTWTVADSEDRPGEVLHVWERWQIEGLRSRRKNRPAKLRLVDPEGVVHKVRSWPKRGDEVASLTGQQINWLLDGYDITAMKGHKKLHYEAVY